MINMCSKTTTKKHIKHFYVFTFFWTREIVLGTNPLIISLFFVLFTYPLCSVYMLMYLNAIVHILYIMCIMNDLSQHIHWSNVYPRCGVKSSACTCKLFHPTFHHSSMKKKSDFNPSLLVLVIQIQIYHHCAFCCLACESFYLLTRGKWLLQLQVSFN